MKRNTRQQKQFELEALEPRVLLSADALLVSAVAADAVIHQPAEVVHHDAVAGQQHFQDSITYNSATETASVFEGVSSQPVQTQTATAEAKPVTHSGSQEQNTPVQNSDSAVQSTAVEVNASAVSTAPAANISTPDQTVSATTTSGSSNTMTQQLTASLTAANGPPATTATSQVSSYQSVTSNTSSTNSSSGGSGTVVNSNASPSTPAGLYSTIEADIAAIESGNTYSTPPTTVTLGGVMTIDGLQLTFVTSGTTVTSVTISATSATLNLGGGVNSTITGLSGSFNPTSKTFSLTLGDNQPGAINISFSSFVNITAASANLTYDAGSTTTVKLSDTTTQSVSLLTVGLSDVTIVAGLNGSTGPGVELDNANLALALMSTSGGTTYYGVAASATALKGVGLPNDLQVGVGKLNVQINGASDGSNNVVNFDASFPNPNGANGLAVPGTSFVLDYSQSLIQVSGTMNLSVADYLQIGGGFSFTQTPGEMDVSVGTLAHPLTFTVGPSSDPIFSASGSLSMTFTSTTFTINKSSLKVNASIQIGSVLEVTAPAIGLSNLSINLATGALSGAVDASGVHDPVLTLTAGSATLFPGGSTITGSVSPTTPGGNGFQGTVDLQTGAFSITLQQFHLVVGSVFTADASNVLLTYDPTGPANQQLVSIGSGTISFDLFSGSAITGNVTNLIIYADGFQFGSLTVSYTGDVTLGPLSLTNPSITLTNFAVTFGSGNTSFSETGSLTVSIDTGSLTIGSLNATVGSLSVTVGLAPDTLGNVTVSAGSLSVTFSTYLNLSASNVTINPTPGNGNDYLTVGTASVTVTIGSLTIGGSASNFSILDNNGTPQFDTSHNFSISLTPPSPSSLGLPSWLGFSITQFGIIWPNGLSDPSNFELTLSAGITSISGVPDTLTVSGSISDVIINVGGLANWLNHPSSSNFPITFGPSGGIGGSVSGTLFGMNVSAAFVGGIVTFNAEGGIFTSATTVVGNDPGDTTVYGSGFYVGIQGSAAIPGLGTVTMSLGFSNLGPLSFYLSYQSFEPLIIDPTTGIALAGLSAGVAFDQTMQVPTTATDLPGVMSAALTAITGSPNGSSNVNVAQWQQSLEEATVAQYLSSNGGTNTSSFFTQPILLLGSVSIADAYLSTDAFEVTGTVVLAINPNAPAGQPPVALLVKGSVMFGGSNGFSGADGYLYGSFSGSGASFMFLVNEPGSLPIESFGGSLTFDFTQNGNPWAAGDTGLPDGFTVSLSGFLQYSALGFASVSIEGTVSLSVTPNQMTIDLSGDVNVSFLGDLGNASGELVLLYPGSTYTATTSPVTSGFTNNSGSIEIFGALDLYTGSAFTKLASYGLVVNGAALFQINTTGHNVLVNLPPPPTASPGTAATPFVVQGSVLFDMTISGTSSTYATIGYQLPGTTTSLFEMQAFLDIRLTNNPTSGLGLQLFADINTLTLGPPSVQLLSFSGFGLFIINSQGLVADIGLTLNSGNAIPDFSFSANFSLVFNTTSQAVVFTVPTVTVPAASGPLAPAGINVYDSMNNLIGPVTTLVIPAGPPQGTLEVEGNTTANWIPANSTYNTLTAAGSYTISSLPAGTYTWTPGSNDTSLTVGGNTYDASGGAVTFTTTAAGPATFVGTGGATINGTLATSWIPVNADYSGVVAGSYTISNLAAGTYLWTPGTNDSSLTVSTPTAGDPTATTTYFASSAVNGEVIVTSTAAGPATFVGNGGSAIIGTLVSDLIPTNTNYDGSGAATSGTLAVGTYLWTPGANDVSLTIDGRTYLASSAVNGQVTITVTTAGSATLAGTASAAITGTLVNSTPANAIPVNTIYSGATTGSYTIGNLAAGTYLWTPGTNDVSLTIGSTTYLASSAVNGTVTITSTTGGIATLAGTANTAITGTLVSEWIPASTAYSGGSYTTSSLPVGTYVWTPGANDSSLTVGSTTYLATNGPVVFTLATAQTVTLSGSQNSAITATIYGAGTYGNVGAAGPYVTVQGSGGLTIFKGTTFELDLTGFFYFQMSYSSSTGFVLALVVNVSGKVAGSNATVTGALQITSAGEVALLSMSGNAGTTTNYGPGISLQVAAELGINTTSSAVSQIGGIPLKYDGTPVTLAANSFQVLASGTLTLDLGGGTGFVINGVFSTTSQSTGSGSTLVTTTTITANGTLTATVGGSTLLSMTASGVLTFTTGAGAAHPGMAAELTLTVNGGNPLDGNGFGFSGTFDLEVNTTGVQQTVSVGTSTDTIAAGPGGSATGGDYAEVHANGTLTFGNATNGFALAGDFYLSAGSSGLVITTSVGFTATIGGSTVMTLNASGAMEITSAGLAASFTLTASSGSPFSMSGAFSFSGTFKLQINTTNQAISTIGGTTVNLPQGPYFQIAVTNATLTLGSSSNGLTLNGTFFLTIGSSGLAVSSTATLNLVLGSTTFFSLTADGALLINSSGIAAKITLGTGTQPGDSNFSFSATFVLEVNTTGSPVTTINNQTVDLPGGSAFFLIEADGSLSLGGGVVSLSGSFNFTVSGGSVQISINAGLSMFGVQFTASGDAGLYSNGIALSIDLSVGGSSSPTVTIIPGVLALSGTFDLQINTTGTSHFGVNANTLFNVYVNASFNVFGFSLASTTFDISVNNGVFSATGQVGFNFFGFATLTVDFYFDSSGNYWFYGSTYVQLGSNSFNIHGTLTVEFASNSEINAYDSFSNVTISHNFYLHVDGGVTAFGYTFANVGADVAINGTNVSISVYVSVNLGLFSIGGTVTINLGTISPVPTPPPPPPIAILNGGVLTLNIGPGSTLPVLPNQNYTITLAADNSSAPGGTENLWISDPGVYTGPAEYSGTSNAVAGAPGGTVEYTGVTSIVVVTGNSNTSINISNNVTVPVTITSGTGTNTYVMGGGTTNITGSGGADTIVGGSGNVTFTMNGGTAVFVGGPAQNVINNDPGTLTVVVGGASSHDYNNYDLNGSVLSFWDTGGTHYSDTINGPAAINLTTPSSGTASFSVENFSGADSLTLNGNSNPGATVSVTNNGDLGLNGSTIGVNGGNITLQSITSVTLIGGSTGDHLTVTNSADIATVNLQGNVAGENFTVNFQGSGAYTVNVTGTGTGNTLTINGTNSNNTYTINGSPVSLGSEIVNYSSIQNLILNTYNGNDTVNILTTTAVTTVVGGSGNDTFNIKAINNATTINLGSGTNTVNVGTLAPTESGGTLNNIDALLTVNGGGGGTDTLFLDDSGDTSNATATLTASSLTGVFGTGGSLDYAGIANFNLYLGNGNHTMNVQGMNGVVNINLGSGTNSINIGSNAGPIVTDSGTGNSTNTGSVLDQIVGTLSLTGTGDNTVNVDDSGGNKGLLGAMTPTSIRFIDPTTDASLLTINLPNVIAINLALSQVADTFVVSDTFTSSSTSPVVVIDGNAGDDTFIVLDTHAVTTINGGDGADSFYNFGNSSVLNLNGNAGDDSFYIYASVSENTTNVGPGAADSNGNTVYSYRVNAPVNVNGGTGNDKLYIFGTVLNDVITINGTSVTGAGIDVNFTNIEQLVVEGLGGNDTFYIESVTVPTTIYGDGSIIPIPTAVLTALGITPPNLNGNAPPPTSFNDTFYVGWQGASYIPGSLADITAPLTIYGDNGPNQDGTTTNTPGTNDIIYVDDSADTAGRNFTLTSSTLTGTGFGTGGELIYDSAVENLNFQLGNGNNTMTVNSTGVGVQTSIYGGRGNDAFIVNDANGGVLQSPLALFGGLNTFAGDTLTLNGAPAGNTYTITGFTIDGAGATISYEEMEQLTINAGGSTTFTVNGDSIPTYLNGGANNDIFNVNANTVSLYLAGGAGNDQYFINANSGVLTASGDSGNGAGNDSFIVNGNSGTLTLNGGAGNDSFLINGNGGALTANGGAGDDSFAVNSLSASATLNGNAGNDTFIVNTPLAAALTINGGGDSGDLLTINGTTGNDYFTITGSAVSGVGATIAYRATNLTVNGLAGNDTFQIAGTSAFTTRVNGGIYGNDTFNVQATTGALYLTGSAVGDNVFNLGSLAPIFGGTLANIAGPVFITGGTNMLRLITLAGPGTNTVNVDDSGDTGVTTGTLTSSTLTGLGMGAGLTFASVNVMNITLGSGTDTFNIQSTNSTTVTTLNTGTGADVVNVGSNMPSGGGVLTGIQGPLTIVGNGEDTLNVDNSGSTAVGTGTLTPTALNGLGMDASGLVYSGLANLNISLGQGNDTFLVANTPSAVTRINGNGGNDTFNVQATTGPLYLNGGSGDNTFNLGSLAPVMTGGTLSGLAGEVFINGGTNVMRLIGLNSTGTNTLNLDDTGDTANATATLGASTLVGLGMGAGVTFVSVNVLNLNLGAGNDTLTVTGASESTVATVDGGPGTNNATFTFTGDFVSPDFTLLNFASGTLSVGGDFTGALNFSGTLTTVTIGGSLTSTGVLTAGAIGTMTVDGGAAGQIIVGSVQVITVRNGSGNILLNVTEGGILREILATPVAGGTMPDTVHFAFVYDSETAANPQAAIRITNTNPVARSFNLALKVVNSSTAKFNLSLLDSYLNSETGVSNISVWGDLLTQLTAPELQLFTGLTANSRAGVVLPSDNITGVEVRGSLPEGFIDVAGIEGLAFGTFTTESGSPITIGNVFGSASNIQVIWNLLGSDATLNLATDAFVNPFNARLYEHINANPDMVLVN